MFSIRRKGETKPPVATSSALALNFAPVSAAVVPPVTPAPEQPARPVKRAKRAKLIFGIDGTASRSATLNMAKPLTDTLLAAVPGELDVALAVYGGNRVTFTPFTSDAGKLRDFAAGIRCAAGFTQLLHILDSASKIEDVGVVVFIGDTYEESERWGRKYADILGRRGTRLIILHDLVAGNGSGAAIFADMAKRSGGAVLPFDASAVEKMKELLSAVAVLAVGGVAALAAQQESEPAARLLLEHLPQAERGKP